MKFNISLKQYEMFLYVNKGLSQKSSNKYANATRFCIFQCWFKDKDWTADNLQQFIFSYQQAGKSQGTINKLITVSKYLDQLMGTDYAASFRCRKEKIKKIDEILTSDEISCLANMEINYRSPWKTF